MAGDADSVSAQAEGGHDRICANAEPRGMPPTGSVAEAPFVSIVICSKNRRQALQTYALPSIQTLQYPCFEVIVVDDGSTDNTRELLQSYTSIIGNLRVVHNQQSRGLCNARNIGISHSRGEFIAFMDDDCAVTPQWLSEHVKAYGEDDIAVVGGVSFRGDSDEIYIDDKHAWGCNMSFRASIFNQFRFDTGLKYSHYADETDLIGRIIAHGFKRVIAPAALARHYVEPASYRKQLPLSGYLNYHYMNAKKGDLLGYYRYVLSHSLKHVAIVEYGINFKHHSRSPISTAVLILRKMVYYLYVLLLEIPIAAKLRHAREEAMVRRGRSLSPSVRR